MSTAQIQRLPEIDLSASDTDLLLRLGIVLALKKRAGWHLVHFRVQGGVVRLAGLVPTVYDRQLITRMARHVAGVLRVEDELAIGDPSIRQQLGNADVASVDKDAKTSAGAWQSQFLHLPLLPESLEDILAQRAAKLAAAG